mmetsp:Transcript_48931/g.57151  ORF Transcript_48931/g.57151 Transcript_48931/m.57151 type:complete len:82 (-) Transcript_48931:46-291(-)
MKIYLGRCFQPFLSYFLAVHQANYETSSGGTDNSSNYTSGSGAASLESVVVEPTVIMLADHHIAVDKDAYHFWQYRKGQSH